MIFDGDCRFCCRWIERWKAITLDAVDFLPFQDESIPQRFPEIPMEDFEEAVHLVLPDGSVTRGAQAVFQSLAEGNRHRWLLGLYRRSDTFADLAELLYEEVAYHRTTLSHWDRIYSGPGIAPPSYIWTRFAFFRGLALIYLVAFGSLWGQIDGLIGSNGILPAHELMDSASVDAVRNHIGLERFHLMPTFGWLSASDSALHWQCGLGIVFSIALLAGAAPLLTSFLLWLTYLSFCVLSGPFLGFQWDSLLLETGFLAIFFAPLQWIDRPSRQARPSALVIWLLRWLIFRLMFESGCVKLMSGDAVWWNLSALRVHYETQPLPTWIAWYAHQWPNGLQTFCTVLMFVIELIVPVFIFSGRRLRLTAAVVFALFQVAIMLTGNYTFFNWLTIVLCIPLLDDNALKWLRAKKEVAVTPPVAARGRRWPWPVTVILTACVIPATTIPLLLTAGVQQQWPEAVGVVFAWVHPLRSFNGYGLFAVMTQTRPEIVMQGSDDRKEWRDYEFKYNPGDVRRRPEFVAPYQPRLDWQMWFAVLDPVRSRTWFFPFEKRLLEGSKPVLDLLATNPFPQKPPKYVRAIVYEYHFTDRETRKKTGDWWRREFKGVYYPALTLEDFRAPARQ